MDYITFDQKLVEKLNEWQPGGWPVGNLIACIIALILCVILVGIVGIEREKRGRSAGLRTHLLVGVGSTIIMIISIYGFPAVFEGHRDVARLAAQVITGVGFLGAGAIMHRDSGVKGLTTAGTIWVSMAIGIACGSFNFILAIAGTLLIFLVLTGFRKVEIKLNAKNPTIILVSNKEPVMIYLDFEMINVVTHLGTDKIEEVVNKYLKKYDQEDDRVKCYVIVKDPDLYLDNFNVDIEGKLDFDLYNDGFEEAHKSIVNSILKDKNGLYLLYGKPGTGKSTYIRHLISECETDKRKFIYVPSKLFADFTDPAILPFLLRNRGCVFVIEDCEDLITVDDGERSDGISDLLNMTDGILADALNIKIICTFNTDYHKIDEALLRPGRCKCKYEFELLDKDRANKVAEKLGLKKVDKDVSLAELFNPEIEYTSESKKKKKIGFNVN